MVRHAGTDVQRDSVSAVVTGVLLNDAGVRHRDATCYLADHIRSRQIRHKCDADGFVGVKYSYMRDVIGGDTREAFEDLRRHAEFREGNWGRQCNRYRTDPFPTGLEIHELTDERIIRAVLSRRQNVPPHLRAIHSTIVSDLKPTDASWLAVEQIRPREKHRLGIDVVRQIERSRLWRIERGHVFVGFDRTGRCQHSALQLSRSVRSTLHLAGEPVVEVDISCCLPTFLAAMLPRWFGDREYRRCLREMRFDDWREYPNKKRFLRSVGGKRGNYEFAQTLMAQDFRDFSRMVCMVSSSLLPFPCRDVLLLASSVRPNLGIPADALLYCSACWGGALYETLMGDGLSRDDVKLATMWVLFGKPGRSRLRPTGPPEQREAITRTNATRNEVRRRFAQLFPSVLEAIDDLKTRNATANKPHAHLALLTQCLEAQTVINTVCRAAVAEGLPVVPIHDALMVPVSQADRARDLLAGTFSDLFGVVPHLKTGGLLNVEERAC